MSQPYQGSEAYKCVMASAYRHLVNRKPYTELAIRVHTRDGNEESRAFFEADLALIEKRMKQLGKDAQP